MEMFQGLWAEHQRFFEEADQNLGEPPPQIAAALAAIQGRLREAVRHAKDEAAKQPLDPEIRKLIEKTTKLPRPDVND